jgi:hypothetical protein
VEARTALTAFNGQGTRYELHSKVISHGARTIANEIKRGRKDSPWQEFAKEVIEGALSRADPSGWGDTDSVKSTNETWEQVVAASLMAMSFRPPHVRTFYCTLVAYAFRSGDLLLRYQL